MQTPLSSWQTCPSELRAGAGQEIGKSCVLVAMGGKRVLFDCGLHMGYTDHRRFPDLSRIPLHGGTLTTAIDAVLITHLSAAHTSFFFHYYLQFGMLTPFPPDVDMMLLCRTLQ